MDPQKILIQLDSDLLPSSFDSIVAFDSGVDKLLSYSEVEELNVLGIVHGAMFTRGPKLLRYTAIFIGGSDVALGERLLKKVTEAFFGPLRVSVMLDSNGSNTTASAAVLTAIQHASMGPGTNVSVLGGTGPVGRRIAQLCAHLKASVTLTSRDPAKAERIIHQLGPMAAQVKVREVVSHDQLVAAVEAADIVFAAGAAGVEMISQSVVERLERCRLLVDVNAIPPLGIGGIKSDDKGVERSGRMYFGALAVGGLKMKIHRAAIQALFESNQSVLDIHEIYALAQSMSQRES